MKLLLGVALFVAVSCSPADVFSQYSPLGAVPFEEYWQSYKLVHNKNYATSEEEETRKMIFSANLKHIEMHNYLHAKGKKSFQLGVNQFTDMTNEEFRTTMNGYKRGNTTAIPSRASTYMSPLVKLQLPDSVDWRHHGYVTPVKNQGQCGSCWAFSTTGSLEGQHFRKTGKLVSLSEQNLVDCSRKWGNNGCDGGLMDYAFQYIKDNDGIDTEDSYPYEGEDEKCHFQRSNVGADDTGFVDITPHGDEQKLQEAVATIGPISIAIDASRSSFQAYTSGIYDDDECSPAQLDHGVLVVGYGSEDGKDFWLVKNSWGQGWGEQGYIRMVRNKDNQCGVATQASYPIV